MVTERCQDGWFKGTSNRTQKCGVFPGNYVAPAKCQRGICRVTTSSAPHQNSPLTTTVQAVTEPRLTVTYTKTKGAAPQPAYNLRSLPPPELPPRSISPSAGVSSSWHGQAPSPPRIGEHPVNPLGRSHSAVMTSASVGSSRLFRDCLLQVELERSIDKASLLTASPGKSMLQPPVTPNSPATTASVDINRSPNNTLRINTSANALVNTASPSLATAAAIAAAAATTSALTNTKTDKVRFNN